MERIVGIDIGAETLKLVELVRDGAGTLRWTRRAALEHHKDPGTALVATLGSWDWPGVASAAATGRLSRLVDLVRMPARQALAAGHRFLRGDAPATLVSIGARGFSVLELRPGGGDVHRENSRCAQGTGNFFRQLVQRFDLGVDEAARMAAGVEDAAALSGRCPVILKTDMTHLANKGESRERIIAGLLDAICANVQVLVKPRLGPPEIHLAGGVCRAERVRRNFERFAARAGMRIAPARGDEGLYLEALGSAVAAAEHRSRVPPLSQLLVPPRESALERLPPLAEALPRVRRAAARPPRDLEGARDVVLGLDIGSTGSKAVARDADRREPLWEAYRRTHGDPVGAAQALVGELLAGPAGLHRVRALAVTGSGREIVGSLLATCYGADRVFVMNEIAAHAAGAVHHDPRVDTIFEIGGQDAKYIRLVDGRVVDAAMNEACSAGTGSFVEEQGSRFEGVAGPAELGEEALRAPGGVAMGQHCSIFMAEVIDEAVAAGVERGRIVAGIFDSVVANYLDRVKGSRPVGDVVFCQGMPFASDALAAAVARQTGAEVVVPPAPGMMGALGIALLAVDGLSLASLAPADLRRFLEAKVERKDTFVCTSDRGCGGGGSRCRIDRITTVVASERRRFTWGGGCALHDHGTKGRKLPDRAPDPFRERRELVAALASRLGAPRGRRVVALTDEFALKGLFPFFATFVHALGLDLRVVGGADRAALRRGIEEANVPFCAPMQQFHGVVAAMAEVRPDHLLLPMLREVPRIAREAHSTQCPIVQAAPDVLRWNLPAEAAARIVSPVVDVGHGALDSPAFLAACGDLAEALGANDGALGRAAWEAGRRAQADFDRALLEIGERALAFARERGVVPVVVLGRSYTLHNDVLNSNVPSILREQGALAIPVDCYPVPDDVPLLEDVFWGYARRMLRAAWHLRRQAGVYGVFCSNYSCGPDSFTAHALAWLMAGRPFAVIETDGHAGDAGTKTRIEAFLHCVREDRRGARPADDPRSEERLTVRPETLEAVRARGERVLLPRMGVGADALAAALRGAGLDAEALPIPTRETIRRGRRHTSGKECLPMTLTLGSLLERLDREREGADRFAFVMPGSHGPCRFGAYKNLHQLVLERLGWSDRVRIWAPPFGNYFEGLPTGYRAITFSGVAAACALERALHDVRPVETRDGEAEAIYREAIAELFERIERAARGDLSGARALAEAASGGLYGMAAILRRAAERFAAAKSPRQVPTVLVTGEVYVRADPGANDALVEQLERRGLRVHLEPSVDFLQWADHLAWANGEKRGVADRIERIVRARILAVCDEALGAPLGWSEHASTAQVLEAAREYARPELEVETVLTLGTPVRAWRRREIEAVVSVGPLECMPNKIAEAQFCHVREREGLLSLSLALNGDPIDPEVLDSFAWEVRARFEGRRRGRVAAPGAGEERLPAGAADADPISA